MAASQEAKRALENTARGFERVSAELETEDGENPEELASKLRRTGRYCFLPGMNIYESEIYMIEDKLYLDDKETAMEIAENYVNEHSLRSYVKNIL